MASKASLAFSHALRESMNKSREEARRAAELKSQQQQQEKQEKQEQNSPLILSDTDDSLDDPQDLFMSVAAKRRDNNNNNNNPNTRNRNNNSNSNSLRTASPPPSTHTNNLSPQKHSHSPTKYTLVSPLKSKADRRERLAKVITDSKTSSHTDSTTNRNNNKDNLLSDDALNILNSDLERTSTDLEIERDCKWRQFWKPSPEEESNNHTKTEGPSFMLENNATPFLISLHSLLLDAIKDPLCFPISFISPYSCKLSASDRIDAILLLFSAVTHSRTSIHLCNRIMPTLMSLIRQNPSSLLSSSSSSTSSNISSPSIITANLIRNCFLALGAREICVEFLHIEEEEKELQQKKKETETSITTKNQNSNFINLIDDTEEEEEIKHRENGKRKQEKEQVPDVSLSEDDRKPILLRLLRVVEQLSLQNEFQFTDVLQIILILVRLDLDLCSNVVHLPIQRTICALIGGIKLGSNNDSDLARKRKRLVEEITTMTQGTSAYLKNQITKSFLPFKSDHHAIILRWIAVSMSSCDIRELCNEHFLYPPSLRLLSDTIRSAPTPPPATLSSQIKSIPDRQRTSPFRIIKGHVDDIALYYTIDTMTIALAGVTNDIFDADRLFASTAAAASLDTTYAIKEEKHDHNDHNDIGVDKLSVDKLTLHGHEKPRRRNSNDIVVVNDRNVNDNTNSNDNNNGNGNTSSNDTNINKRKEYHDQKSFMLSYFSPSSSSPLSSPTKKRKTTVLEPPSPSSVDIIITSSSSSSSNNSSDNENGLLQNQNKNQDIIVINGNGEENGNNKNSSMSENTSANSTTNNATTVNDNSSSTNAFVRLSGRQIRESMTELIKVLKTFDNRLRMDIKTGNPERNVTKNAILRLWHGLDYQLRAAGWQVDVSGDGRQQMLYLFK